MCVLLSAFVIVRVPIKRNVFSTNICTHVFASSPFLRTVGRVFKVTLSFPYRIMIIGYGKDNVALNTRPTVLQHAEINYIPNSQCNTLYNGWRGLNVTDSMMCASVDGVTDACQGDSGGPLFDREYNVLVGVVSWGKGCAEEGYPSVYSRIANQVSLFRCLYGE